MNSLVPVYAELRQIMTPCAARLDVKRDDAEGLYVDTRHIQKNGKPLFFGTIQAKKSCVALHLMPVYLRPELLASVSPALKARMQGKPCSKSSPP